MTIGGIYFIINLFNGKYYVGSTFDFNGRWSNHKSDLRYNIHNNIYLQHAYNKYGEEYFQFTIVETVIDVSKLSEIEQLWLDASECCNPKIGYNLSPTANSTLGYKHTEESKNKMRNRRHSDETKAKIGVSKIGVKRSKEFCKRMSELHKGKVVSVEARAKMSKSHKGRTVANRDINKWPHDKGNRCPCSDCKKKRTEYNREYKNERLSTTIQDSKAEAIQG